MSKHKNSKNKNGAQIVVGGAKKSRNSLKKLNFRSRGGIIAILTVVISVALIVAGGWFAANQFMNIGSNNDTKKTNQKDKAKTKNYSGQSVGDPTAKGYKDQLKAIDKKIEKSTDNAEKSDLYTQKLSLEIINKGYSDAVVGYAKQAEDLAPTSQTALNLADTYYALEKPQDALPYYKLYLSRILPEDKAKNLPVYEHYQQLVKQIEEL